MNVDKSLLKSLSLHILCLMVLAMSLRFNDIIQVSPASIQIMEAVMIDQSAKIKMDQASDKQRENAQKLKEIEKQNQEKLAEKQKKAADAEKQAIEQQKKAADAEKKAMEQQKKTADAEKKVIEQQKKAVAAEKKAVEHKKKAAEQQKVARQKALQQEAEQALQEQLQTDQQQAQMQADIAQYHQLIIAKIQQHWRRDLDQTTGLSCLVKVRVLSTGEVIQATIERSSGHAAFDRSATSAVMRASPLPLPEEARAKNEFVRGFNFLFKPEDA